VAAGIGGLVKAGRWAPVQVAIGPTKDIVDGELVVSWGTATVRRRIDLAGPAGRRFEIYIRTSEVASVVTVQVRVGGGVGVAQAEAPVRALAQAERVVLCAGDDRPITDADCSGTIAPEQLPSSPRGYDAVDRVVFAGSEAALTSEQREALAVWHALHALNETGELGLVGQVARPTLPRGLPAPLLRIVAALTTVYVGVILLVGVTRSFPSRPFRHGYLVLGVVVACGSGTVLAIGAGLPGRPIVVHHASLIEQLPGTTSAIVTIRGVVEFPAATTFDLRWPLTDAMLEPASAAGGPEHTIAANGHPVLAGLRGLGRRQAFSGEAVARAQLLAVRMEGQQVTVTNESGFDLTDCQFAGGFEPQQVGPLVRGASATSDQLGESAGPVFTCSFDGALVPFEEPHTSVLSTGATVVAVYR
jgi:hypothetical protein